MRSVLLLVLSLFLSIAASAQQELQQFSTVKSSIGDVVILSAAVAADGEFVTAGPGGETAARLAAELPPEAPTLTTTWTDAKGVTHTVSTPIPSTTPAGLAKATQLHLQLVQTMQTAFPPAPPPQPAPPAGTNPAHD